MKEKTEYLENVSKYGNVIGNDKYETKLENYSTVKKKLQRKL